MTSLNDRPHTLELSKQSGFLVNIDSVDTVAGSQSPAPTTVRFEAESTGAIDVYDGSPMASLVTESHRMQLDNRTKPLNMSRLITSNRPSLREETIDVIMATQGRKQSDYSTTSPSTSNRWKVSEFRLSQGPAGFTACSRGGGHDVPHADGKECSSSCLVAVLDGFRSTTQHGQLRKKY